MCVVLCVCVCFHVLDIQEIIIQRILIRDVAIIGNLRSREGIYGVHESMDGF